MKQLKVVTVSTSMDWRCFSKSCLFMHVWLLVEMVVVIILVERSQTFDVICEESGVKDAVESAK